MILLVVDLICMVLQAFGIDTVQNWDCLSGATFIEFLVETIMCAAYFGLPIVGEFHGSDKIYRPEPPMKIEQGTLGFAWDGDDKNWRTLIFYVKNDKDNGQSICKYENTTGDDAVGSAYDHFVPLKKDDVYFDKNGHMHIKESVAKAL